MGTASYPRVGKDNSQSLILKDKFLFGYTEIEIIYDGECHLGAVIGGKEARETYTYVKTNVEKCVKDLEELSEITLEEQEAELSKPYVIAGPL